MGQFCVYNNPSPRTRVQYPYLLDIQSDLLSKLRTTVVIPLAPSKIAAPISLPRLNPAFTLDGGSFTAMTQDVAGVDRKDLGTQAYDLATHRSEIISAVDLILFGI